MSPHARTGFAALLLATFLSSANAAPGVGVAPRKATAHAARGVGVAARKTATPRGAPPGPKPFGAEAAISIVSYSDLQWSPDGRRLVFVVAAPDTVESTTNYDVYLADPARQSVRRLTRNPKGDSSPSFSSGGDTLAFVATRGGDTQQTIYMLSLEGGDPWVFGSFDEAVGEVHWSPDGRYLAYTKNDTLPRRVIEQRRRKWDPTVEGEQLQFPHLWVADLVTGERRRLTSGAFHVWNARWSPDSRSLAFLVNPTHLADDANLTDIAVVPAAGGPMRRLGSLGGDFSWSPDSRSIAWAAGAHRDVWIEKDDVWVCRVASGSPVKLTGAFDENPGTPAWNVTSDTLYFHVGVGVSTLLATVPAQGGTVRLVADRNGGAGTLAISPAGRAAWVESRARVPDEIVVADHPELKGVPVTNLNAPVAALAMGEARVVRSNTADGNVMEGLVYRPPGEKSGTPLKTIVLLHGGPYGFRADLAFNWWPQFLVGAGYQVYMPNFRGSGGYGAAFMKRERGDWGGQDWSDVMLGVDNLVRLGLADPDRLGIAGASYGGYLSAWGITNTNRFKAAYIDRGISDLPALWGQSDTHQYRTYDFGGRPWEEPARWRDRSPLTGVGNARTPMLITVGDNDARTPIAQSRALYESLKSLGVPVQFVHYPREGHGLREPRHRADAMLRSKAWFDRWLQ